jgi:hypothetical protein
MLLSAVMAQAQINIGGNVYGGGNAGKTGGQTTVTVRAGDIDGSVFGGARQADVVGSAFVNIDGEHMSADIVINYVYGGNDIAGKVGESVKETDPIPEGLTDAAANGITPAEGETNAGKNTKKYSAFVLTTKERTVTTGTGESATTSQPYHIFIGQLFGGGNGDYDYKSADSPYQGMIKPELGKTYLELRGGTIAYAYGGGNNATVTAATDICVNNSSSVTTDEHLKTILNIDADGIKERMKKMGLNTVSTQVGSNDFQFARVFGGNNKAEMAIQPTWHLKDGKIRNLYSGGNQGAMTHKEGLLLEIQANSSIVVDNVFGGCRMAAVRPLISGTLESRIFVESSPSDIQLQGYNFPAGLSARVLVRGGDINNVYGGNDISGDVTGGNAVGIYASVRGDVYGGGNGSYAYTDNADLAKDDEYKDFYYPIPEGKSSVEALNAFRPNAEAVSIRVMGTADKTTVIGGAICCGGNSATLRNDNPNQDAASELKIGSYVIADKVFLGNNGANMVTEDILKQYAGNVTVEDSEGQSHTYDFSQIDLASETKNANDQTQFDQYMEGVTMMIKPRVVFDSDYVPYSTMFGSIFCGGNVGSMKIDGAFEVSFNDKVIIYDKVVGGSNEANVYQSNYNAQYLGGLLGNPDTNGNKLILNFGGLKIQPKRWKMNGDEYALDGNGNRILEWNTVDSRTFNTTTKKYTPMDPVTTQKSFETLDLYRRFQGGNIYGGCYNNGHVNGNVVINLNASLVDRKGDNAIFDQVEENEGEAKLYDGNYNITKRYTGVLLGEQGMDPLGRALNVFGGGYGGDSEIWGSATINLNAGYTFQIFGGGEQGAIGEAISHAPDPDDPTAHNLTYKYDHKYSTYINLKDRNGHAGTYRGDTDNSDGAIDYEDVPNVSEAMAEAEFIYGGSFEGLIAGDTHINLGNGRIFNTFAGSCNADILGHTETYVGRMVKEAYQNKMGKEDANENAYELGFPWIRDHIYGGNDLGGRILGEKDFKNRVSSDIVSSVYNPKSASNPDVLKASAYTEYIQGRVEYIFGGCYGDYDYTNEHYRAYANADGTCKDGFNKPWMKNAFVNFKPNNAGRNAAKKVYGAGQGHTRNHPSDDDRDKMQDRSYVLIDIPQSNTNFQDVEVFGAGDYSGLGMRYNTSDTTIGETTIPALTPAIAKNNGDGVTASTVVDLMRGQVKDVYGASYKGGITRRTIVNVPTGSTIRLNRIFGGGYGVTNTKPCDVYESNVNYHSAMAMASGSPDDIVNGNQVAGGIYGGNNNCRRTLYARLNIDAPVRQNEAGYTSRVFGAGYGKDTWTQYTEINLNDGANVYEAYGGGYGGMVLNKQSAANYTTYTYEEKNETTGETETKTGAVFQTLPEEYTNATAENGGLDGSLNGYLVNENPLGKKTNTNVCINKGAYVAGYCYGGGLGSEAVVSGTTYIGLHGGEVSKDMYGGGWGGPVYDKYDVKDFVATTNVFVEGGTLRNVYGGGYQGSVGKHTTTETLPIAGSTVDDILGLTNVVVGIRSDQTEANLLSQLKKTAGKNATKSDYGYYHGVPAIQRNAYSGGEGGAVFGEAHLTLNNGYVGYVYLLKNEKQDEQGNKVKLATTPEGATDRYEAKIHDETYYENKVWKGKDRLKDYGNLFGGGYDDLSCTDESFVEIWGGTVRSSVHGGGEIATIGRGRIIESGVNNSERVLLESNYYKDGKTHIKMYNGHVLRNVFGGGKGYNINGYGTGANKLYTDGYVFGQTEVYIHGGEIGTEEGVALQTDGTGGYGNVFGGGDVGYVYSPSYFSEGTAAKENTGSPNHIYYKDGNGNLTEDCKVVIAPMLQVKPGKSVSYLGVDYGPYEYVPTEYLNTLPTEKSDSRWRDLFTGDKKADGTAYDDDPVERGVHIHNAVFAGGNVSSNTESFANSITVFGNTTATLYDVYHRDFITVGTEHVGGLYGGGNLSMVGGYRELNITNYGTDYYGMDDQISLEKYQTLTNRERAYFKLEYVCQKDVTINEKPYTVGYRISEDDYNALPEQYKTEDFWKQYGFCSIYAGRLLNTIQRADFCGVFGSRLVLQGAKDRVADVADGTEYTINRIGELSLNQQRFTPGSDAEIHGNYFGIYSVVNYLGNLTSDVRFVDDKRRYVDGGQVKEDTKTYYDWKIEHLQNRDRNNGTSYNQVALASGVYLEITSEKSTPTNKIYGDITGVVELDLINVKKDIEGGGYVYARNEHGQWYEVSHDNTLLSPYNKKDGDEALTKKIYAYYTDAAHLFPYQTSGNFIHKSKRIVDDCYPNNGVYKDDKGVYVTSPAHYWFIKGEVYIYDQVVSAYAGSATAYRKEVKIPLTITAGSNGKLKLLNIQPSLYAYYQTYDNSTKTGTVIDEDGVAVDNESMTFHLNDVITWWDWNQLSDSEKKYFVKDTYVNVDSCTIGGTPYSAGTYILENDPSAHASGQKTAYESFLANHPEVKDAKGDVVTDLTKLFRSSNNMSHDTGYVLTFDMNSPKDWDDWYTPIDGNSGLSKIRKDEYNALSPADKEKYREGPTYTLTSTAESGLYGQRNYTVGEIMTEETYKDYTTTVANMTEQPTGQAVVERAYVALASIGNTQAGSAISTTAYNDLADKSNYALAMVCTNTIQLGEEEYILMGELVSETETNLEALAVKYMNYNNSLLNADQIDEDIALQYIKDNLSKAYYVKTEGLYGGQYYQKNINYGALKSWCVLSESRNNFEFNYDALDVLIDPEYHGEGYTETYYKSPYSDIKSVEYVAAYLGTGSLTYYDNYNNEHTIASGGTIEREDYENVRNDQMHYTRLQLDQATATGDNTQTFYIVTENIINNGTPYAKGQDISEKDYNSLTDGNKNKVKVVTFTKDGTIKYYCYETYSPGGESFTPERGSAGALGSVISAQVFSNGNYVPNYQKAFTIQGSEPTETTTLYVSRESNAKDVMSEKVITVVYQYTYYEADDEGDGVSLVNELHVVNIHVKLESGAPQIGPLTAPSAVLPGNTVRMKAPSVNPGLYEVITNGWEIFSDEDDAALHRNGKPFINNGTPLYWYENQKRWVAFYSSTYLGKTYSNYVPLTVANYHDMDAVMKDTEHHLYVDHPDVLRKSKIYIDNRDCESDNTKSELDLFKDFFDLSVSGLEGHEPLNNRVKGGSNLEFFLNSNVSPKAYTNWTPIGNDDQCFMGNLHGDGYMISGLDHSLFGKLCGNVYNLGVTGSFTSAGVVDTGEGYVENCWVKSSAETVDDNVLAVFGHPSDESDEEGLQIVNCYYWDANKYSTTEVNSTHPRGVARAMTDREFYNGTVAYNLNGFYLNKRFYDKQPNSGTKYQYLKSENGTLSEEMIDGYYPPSYAFYPIDAATTKYGYVENRYADGDFVYANGTIPQSNDERMRVVNDDVVYVPIWPDDYLYFGQMLTYGYDSSIPHEDLPSHIAKNSGRLTQTALSNRVYRAPAYFRSKDMDVAHFNLKAYLAAYSAPKTVTDTDLNPAYPGMTAIDFAGHGDQNYILGLSGNKFYPPLLDDDGLIGVANKGETPNLLVYAPSSTANEMTYDVLNGYFIGTSDARYEPVYSDYTESRYEDYNDGNNYGRIAVASTSTINGHLVQSNLQTTTDHLLVDKRDFNCPIVYDMGEGYRMWYQRDPDKFVDRTKGWEGVSLPFTADIVTTNVKGEITHFYDGSAYVDQDTKTKVGHEYWLRELKDGGTLLDDNKTYKAEFNYPTAVTSGDDPDVDKTVTNTFLWDYYYEAQFGHKQFDANRDKYQTYYSSERTYDDYARLKSGTPYIIGFPGATYYEFDLSGNFSPANTAGWQKAARDLKKQVITFASKTGAKICVSDDAIGVTEDGYTFMPTYLNNPPIADDKTVYQLDNDGDSFDETDADGVAITAFRPYFIGSETQNPGTRTVEQIVFGQSYDDIGVEEHGDPRKEEIIGGLRIWTKKDKIFVESTLSFTEDVRVVTPAGITVAAFVVEPGQTVEVQADFSGMYIVHTLDGKYTKKVAVKRE